MDDRSIEEFAMITALMAGKIRDGWMDGWMEKDICIIIMIMMNVREGVIDCFKTERDISAQSC